MMVRHAERQYRKPEKNMTTAEILLEDFDAEMAGTRKTLERIPEDNPNYKPHEKSMVCGKLAMHVAALPLFAKYILTEPGMNMADSQLPKADLTFRTRDIMLATFDAYAADARKALAAASDEDLGARWKFS